MSFVDLPRIVNIENVKVTVPFLTNAFVFLLKIVSLSYLINYSTEQFFNGLLFFSQYICVTIILCKKGSQYYLADSHAEDTEGKSYANGSRIIISLRTLLN